MVRIIMNGCNGHMGRVISELVEKDENAEIAAGIDVADIVKFIIIRFIQIVFDCDKEADVMIDFSSPKATDNVLKYCVEKKLPLVLCTTGLSEEQLSCVNEAAKETAVLRSANMSLGINTLLKLLQDAAKVLATAGFDMEIVERHHNQKIDAPSGTAILLADAVNEGVGGDLEYVYDRSQVRQKKR